MKTKHHLFILLAFLCGMRAQASTQTIWQGNKSFTSWADVVNIDGSKFANIKSDDVLRFCLTAQNGAQLQVSYGNSWTNLAGLEALAVKKDYELTITSRLVPLLNQGIHIKGVNYTLTAVEIESNDAEYSTESEHLFGWENLLTSGANRGDNSVVGIDAYGGTGWHWPDGEDLSPYAYISVELQKPASEAIIVQLLYDVTGCKRLQIAKGSTSCKISLNSRLQNVYSLNFMSEKAQNISFASINLYDKEGNVITTGINDTSDNPTQTEGIYYNLSGIRQSEAKRGIMIEHKGNKTIKRLLRQ